jgi:hypothetical protein
LPTEGSDFEIKRERERERGRNHLPTEDSDPKHQEHNNETEGWIIKPQIDEQQSRKEEMRGRKAACPLSTRRPCCSLSARRRGSGGERGEGPMQERRREGGGRRGRREERAQDGSRWTASLHGAEGDGKGGARARPPPTTLLLRRRD